MKVAYILNTYPAPSHSFIRREIRALEGHGLEVLRLAMRPWAGPLPDPADAEEAARTTHILHAGALGLLLAVLAQLLRQPAGVLSALVRAVRLGWRSEAGILRHLIYWAEGAAVARRTRSEGVERMHAHFGTNAATVAMLANRMGAPPFSFTVHGPEEFDKPGQIGLTDKLAAADFAVAVSSYGRSQLMRLSEPQLWPHLHVIHCGVEPARFAEPTPVPDRRPLRLVAVGRMAEQKGHLTLIEALAEVDRREVPVELVLIGDGPMRSLIENAIAREGLGSAVRLTGWLDEAGVRAELDAAHGLVLPSYAEGLPLVLMEAMVSMRPVIATWVAGIPELVHPGRNGWLVPAGDAGALAGAIIEMATTPNDVLVKMGKSARARALARHSVETEAAKLARLFAQRPRTQPD
jgi:glycosyltransferase involved in cell wall biosynthesis